ncbi:hypothetical protein FRC00_004311 [Tulasnella sp. 408]|nr:hypothetical protein FRC00_004311 [Tulasnella sp. 408]
MTAGSGTAPVFTSFGKAGNYLWGNMTAHEILNLPMNEGNKVKNQDLTLCFAASGDLRNVIKTLNSLPMDYSGRCTLVINDFHPQIAIRNVVLLCMLLDTSGPSAELTAEAVLHALYSASMTSAQSKLFSDWMDRIAQFIQGASPLYHGEINYQPSAKVEWWYPQDVADLLRKIKNASFTKSTGEVDRRMNMVAPQRIDYRERYCIGLRPRHRIGYFHFLDTGVLLPLGQPVDSFDKPNKLLYSEDAEWLLADSASPVQAWDPLEVEDTRKKMGLPDEDYFGSLFFHIKQQLVDFIARARQFKLSVLLFSVDLNTLPELLDLAMEGKQRLMFDRVETSNVMDTTGPSSIISTWGPRLNRKNPHSALLLYSMNFSGKVKDGRAEKQPQDKMGKMMMELTSYLGFKKGANLPPIQLIIKHIAAFFDTRRPFAEYLRQEGVPEACRKAKRVGVGLKEYDSPKITLTPEEFYLVMGEVSIPRISPQGPGKLLRCKGAKSRRVHQLDGLDIACLSDPMMDRVTRADMFRGNRRSRLPRQIRLDRETSNKIGKGAFGSTL